jgi:hypothetical protein
MYDQVYVILYLSTALTVWSIVSYNKDKINLLLAG